MKLRNVRLALATITFVTIHILFIGLSWTFTQYLVWVSQIQFQPAILALNFAVIIATILVTLIFGRIYCSTVCPLGVMQDLFGWVGKKVKKNRYRYSPEKKILRYTVFAVYAIALAIGFAPIGALLEPYSAYGRIVNSIFGPLYDLIQNALAKFDAGQGGATIPTVKVWFRSVSTFVVALLTLISLGILSWRNGRTYCNTFCPVGTLLSFFSRFSWMRIRFDKDKCKKCSKCEKQCKAAAIDFRAGTVDYTRCVVCGDCIAICEFDALHYKPIDIKGLAKKQNPTAVPAANTLDEGRRAFLVGAAVAAGTAATARTKFKVDGGLAVLEDKVAPKRDTPITPPGSISARHLQRQCTACQLCVSACPNDVLRPSSDPLRFMQPEMSFEHGFCRPECHKCSDVCPSDAIKPITVEQKTAIHIGHAVWVKENCIPLTNGDHCGHCADVCPSRAIQMVDYTTKEGNTVQVPAVDAERCIGCGKCEHLCPARPFTAIYVEGNSVHHID